MILEIVPPVAVRGTLVDIRSDGYLCVCLEDGNEVLCEWLTGPSNKDCVLELGDTLLVLSDFTKPSASVALGRIGRYSAPTIPLNHTIEASRSLSLRCGESSIDLRADGKVLIKGDDVTVRAKGTKRIRAGTVSIN